MADGFAALEVSLLLVPCLPAAVSTQGLLLLLGMMKEPLLGLLLLLRWRYQGHARLLMHL